MCTVLFLHDNATLARDGEAFSALVDGGDVAVQYGRGRGGPITEGRPFFRRARSATRVNTGAVHRACTRSLYYIPYCPAHCTAYYMVLLYPFGPDRGRKSLGRICWCAPPQIRRDQYATIICNKCRRDDIVNNVQLRRGWFLFHELCRRADARAQVVLFKSWARAETQHRKLSGPFFFSFCTTGLFFKSNCDA